MAILTNLARQKAKNLNMEQQSEKLNLKFEEWKGNLEQVDNVLVLGIKI